MKDQQSGDRPAAREAQPWHAADEPKPARPAGGPVGTHSFTGAGASVGMPTGAEAGKPPERSAPRDMPPGAQEPDPMAEPRANLGEILGNKP